MTRVCMLFKGILNVVGVDPVRAGDVTLFRLLEWGGIEVLIRYSISSLDLC
ncbi:uncharacterized protein BJ212DRAFT_1314458 [Suillus subaureus]|uniref:Uncharacterized protein n=1 Tax=Suillus subaureus TaxID=48587 RepID=A0A9P7EMT2_9AGAM|nr:uncharacterized protein BJ212DRAFT_1314458 [Suillus subaureus]KAG1825502.1 hypothetical protein BJ212DRAFT_1314458 [Suillus subaureus]